MFKKLFSVLFALSMVFLLSAAGVAAEGDVVVLYTNDIHTYIGNNLGEGNENGLTYSKVAALKSSFKNAILVDAGDHIQGTAYGGMDEGATIIELMNAAGYDVATLGNHEFDYGMDGCMATIAAAEYPYVSCNFCYAEDGVMGEKLVDSYTVIEAEGKKIAFVGITTPETLSSTRPAYFQDENGSYIYDIVGRKNAEELYAEVQATVDAASAEADYVIALGHLGVDLSSSPWTSREVIANTTGLDAFIDGHSHTTIEMEEVTDKNGDTVILTQTGSYLDAIGKMTISADGSIRTELIYGEDIAGLIPDAEVKAIEDAWIAEVSSLLGEVVGYAEVVFDNYDEDGNRLVRKQETNSGDFTADALYYMFDEMGMDVDVAINNGGNVRNYALTGEITYLSCKNIHTFGNVACLQTITGQQLLDALEWAVRELSPEGSMEAGSFMHISGATYTIDLSVPSTVQFDENGNWIGGPTGEYRVKDLKIFNQETGEYELIDLTAKYNIAGYNYTLRDYGSGFTMFKDAVNVLDYAEEDYMVLARYIKSFPVNEETGLPTIPADSIYADVNGAGRITIIGMTESEEEAEPVIDTALFLNPGLYRLLNPKQIPQLW